MPYEVQIFTIGHSSHPMDRFLDLLQQHGIEAVVDIRRFPGSRQYPHFSRENLAVSLADEDIEYHWLEALGGRRHRKKTNPPSPNPGLRDQSFRNYADYMATDGFQQGVAKLLAIAGNRRTAIMCAEGLYWHPIQVAVDQLVGCSLVLDRQFHRRLVGHWIDLLLPPHDDDKANARSQQRV